HCNRYTLVTAAKPVKPTFNDTEMLVSPLFYQDTENVFFVEPTLREPTIDRWERWVITPPVTDIRPDDNLRKFPIVSAVPIPKLYLFTPPIDPRARFEIQPKIDWFANPATVLQFGDRVVGQTGGLNPSVITAGARSTAPGASVNLGPGEVLNEGDFM